VNSCLSDKESSQICPLSICSIGLNTLVIGVTHQPCGNKGETFREGACLFFKYCKMVVL
jgi:hypothetical protein